MWTHSNVGSSLFQLSCFIGNTECVHGAPNGCRRSSCCFCFRGHVARHCVYRHIALSPLVAYVLPFSSFIDADRFNVMNDKSVGQLRSMTIRSNTKKRHQIKHNKLNADKNRGTASQIANRSEHRRLCAAFDISFLVSNYCGCLLVGVTSIESQLSTDAIRRLQPMHASRLRT